MAFFKEKIVGNLSTVTAVDWGRSIGEGLNYDALNKYYQRKFDQKIKDLELTPQVFDTTLSFLQPKIQSKVLELQNEYKSNADVSYRKADFSDVAINARQRNAEILKELTKMEAGIQSLEEAETEFANNPDAFFPHETNTKLSARETKLRAAYTELINGDYKSGQADEVLDVYFKDGKTIVKIDGIGDVELNDLRPYDQPREGLYSTYSNDLAQVATTASTNTAEASALLTKILGSIDNDLNYSDIQDLLDFQITIPTEFQTETGLTDTLRIQNDDAYRKLFESVVENAGEFTENWESFINPEVRKEQGMKLKAGVEQPDIVQGVETFVRSFTQRIGNQFIEAGKKIQDDKRQQEIDDYLQKIKDAEELKGPKNTAERIAAGLKGIQDNVVLKLAENENNARFFETTLDANNNPQYVLDDNNVPVLKSDLTPADLTAYNKRYLQEIVRRGGNVKGSVNTYDEAKSYLFRSQDRVSTVIDEVKNQIREGIAGDDSKADLQRVVLERVFNALDPDKIGTVKSFDLEVDPRTGLQFIREGKSGGIKYYQFTGDFVEALSEAGLISQEQEQSVMSTLTSVMIYETGDLKANAQIVDILKDIAFNRFVGGTDFVNKSGVFTIKDGDIRGHVGNATTEQGRIDLMTSLLNNQFISTKTAEVIGVMKKSDNTPPPLNVPIQ